MRHLVHHRLRNIMGSASHMHQGLGLCSHSTAAAMPMLCCHLQPNATWPTAYQAGLTTAASKRRMTHVPGQRSRCRAWCPQCTAL